MIEIIGLQQHVAELGVADAIVAVFHAGADRLLGHHGVDSEVLAHVAQELEVGDGPEPIEIVHQSRGIVWGVEVQEPGQLLLDRSDVVLQHVRGQQVALGRTTAGITNHAGCSTGQCERHMTGELETSQAQKRHQIAHVQRISRGIKAAIQGHRSRGEPGRQGFQVGAIGVEAPPAQFVENVHRRADSITELGRRKQRFAFQPLNVRQRVGSGRLEHTEIPNANCPCPPHPCPEYR